MSKSTETKTTQVTPLDQNPHKHSVTLADFMAGIAFLGYAINKFEDIHVPEGSTLGEVVGRESYAWAQAMFDAKQNSKDK
jgi:hypothetical protein